MAVNANLTTYPGAMMSPQDFAIMVEKISSQETGILYGCTASSTGGSTVNVTSGWVLVKGRLIQIDSGSLAVELPTSTVTRYLYVEVDLSNSDGPCTVSVETTTKTDSTDFNVIDGTAYCLLATLTIGTSGITGISNAPVMEGSESIVNDILSSIATVETSPATANHATGEYIIYNRRLYKVTSAITAGATLTVGTNISAASVGDEITSLLDYRIITATGTNLNDYKTAGVYYFSSSVIPTNIPDGVNGWLIVLANSSGSWFKQFWSRQGTANSNDSNTYIRTYTAGTWSAWDKFVTERDASEAWSSATINSSYIGGGTVKYKKIGKLVFLRCMDILVSATIPTSLTQLASGLPKAESTTAFVLTRYNDGTPIRVAVTTGGILNAHYLASSIAASNYQFYGSVVYRSSE